MYLFTPALGRKPEEVVTSNLVACSFPADVGEGEVNLAIPLVAAIEYVYKNTLVREYFGPDMLKELTRTAKEKGLM